MLPLILSVENCFWAGPQGTLVWATEGGQGVSLMGQGSREGDKVPPVGVTLGRGCRLSCSLLGSADTGQATNKKSFLGLKKNVTVVITG